MKKIDKYGTEIYGPSKIRTIAKQVQGNPETTVFISWNDFVMDMEFTDEKPMIDSAIYLIQGEFLYADNGYMYKLITVDVIED